jgi:hypothetical protein
MHALIISFQKAVPVDSFKKYIRRNKFGKIYDNIVFRTDN